MDTSKDHTAVTRVFDDNEVETICNKIINKELTYDEAIHKYRIPPGTLTSSLACFYSQAKERGKIPVFTKEQEKVLKEHIIKCSKVQYGLTISTMRIMAYEYAVKLPECDYPKKWDDQKMATMDWFRSFRSRHPDLKKVLTKKYKSDCICIMGCHMGPEGKTQLNKLEAKVLIARVYHYLHKEYEYMKMCNDLSLLVNILRRTAEATGVCEQTITSILEDEQKTKYTLQDAPPPRETKVRKRRKKNGTLMSEHDYTNKASSGESSTMDTVNNDSNSASSMMSKSVISSDLDSNIKHETTNIETKGIYNRVVFESDEETVEVTNNMTNEISNGNPGSDQEEQLIEMKVEVEETQVEDRQEVQEGVTIKTDVEAEASQPEDCPMKEESNCKNIKDNEEIDESQKEQFITMKMKVDVEETQVEDRSNVDMVVEGSNTPNNESSNSVVYSDFERLQQGSTLIKSIQVEILEDEDESNEKPDADSTMDMTVLGVDGNKEEKHKDLKKELKRKRNRERQRAYYHRQKDLKKNGEKKKVPKTNAERQREFRQRRAEKTYVDIVPDTVEKNEEKQLLQETIDIDDNNDEDNTYDAQRDPRSLLRNTTSLFYTPRYYSNKLKTVDRPIDRVPRDNCF